MKALLAINHRLLRDSIRPLLLKLTPKPRILEAGTLDTSLAMAANDVTLVILRHCLPGTTGAAGIEMFRSHFPAAKLVFLTVCTDPALMLAAVSAGANGIIMETISGQGMLNALRLVMAGETYLPSDAVIELAKLCLGRTVDPLDRGSGSAMSHLSPAEMDVVPLLLDGLSNKVIALRLGLKEAAIKARMRGLYKKIGATNRAQAIWALMHGGYIRSS